MPTSIKIDPALSEQVQRLANLHNSSASQVMLEAIKQYVQREEARGNFRSEALDSWDSYKKTSLHLTGEETCDWLNSWGSKNEEAIPVSHK